MKLLKYLFRLIIVFVVLFTVELYLNQFMPITFAPIGYIFSENEKLYGWGYYPNQHIKMRDPNTGELFEQQMNNRGWRDKNRTFIDQEGTYRILLLGDFVTFGANVPAERIYTRILETELRINGFNAEVINIACENWGTDQQLEALKIEGLKYKPRLVIIQFHLNDLWENTYFIRWDPYSEQRKRSLPFYYALNDNNLLYRDNNHYCKKKWKDNIKLQILKTEMGKRLYSSIFDLKRQEMARLDESLSFRFNSSEEGYTPNSQSVDSYSWQLYFALIDKTNSLIIDGNAQLALFCPLDDEMFEGNIDGHGASADIALRKNFMQYRQIIHDYSKKQKIGFVIKKRRYPIFRDETNYNIQGHKAMAEDIYDFLMENHKEDLDAFRLKHSSEYPT